MKKKTTKKQTKRPTKKKHVCAIAILMKAAESAPDVEFLIKEMLLLTLKLVVDVEGAKAAKKLSAEMLRYIQSDNEL